jgi:aspartate/tyrosine/aromatic aminotransferase
VLTLYREFWRIVMMHPPSEQPDLAVRLRNEFGVYGTDTGRMCVAALNSKNIDYVCACIAKVL